MNARVKDRDKSGAIRHEPRPIVAPLILLLAAGVLSVLAATQFRSLWLRLPLPRLERLDRQAVRNAFSNARATMSAEVHGGNLLAAVGERFPAAIRDSNEVPEILEDARAVAAQVARSQLGRVQLAALTMLRLKQQLVPADAWWPSVQPYLAGLENATFQHFLPELIDADAAVYQRLGLAPGSARRSAQRSVGCPHTVFLQTLAEHIERLAEARSRAGDSASAALCRRLVRRLLREWTLAPGPPELRLLAADLLAQLMGKEAAGNATVPGADLAQALRIWRLGCKARLGALSPPTPLLGVGHEPELSPQEENALLQGLALCTWLLSAGAAAALASLALLAPWLMAKPPLRVTSRVLATGMVVALAMVAAGILWPLLLPQSVDYDFRRLGSSVGWPYHPFLAGGLALVLLGITTMLPVTSDHRPRRRLARIAGPALVAWMILAAAGAMACAVAERSRALYETRVAAALTAAETSVPAEAGNDVWLDGLRAWTPGGENAATP